MRMPSAQLRSSLYSALILGEAGRRLRLPAPDESSSVGFDRSSHPGRLVERSAGIVAIGAGGDPLAAKSGSTKEP